MIFAGDADGDEERERKNRPCEWFCTCSTFVFGTPPIVYIFCLPMLMLLLLLAKYGVQRWLTVPYTRHSSNTLCQLRSKRFFRAHAQAFEYYVNSIEMFIWRFLPQLPSQKLWPCPPNLYDFSLVHIVAFLGALPWAMCVKRSPNTNRMNAAAATWTISFLLWSRQCGCMPVYLSCNAG